MIGLQLMGTLEEKVRGGLQIVTHAMIAFQIG